MNISDYGYATDYTNIGEVDIYNLDGYDQNNWLFTGAVEWTMSRTSVGAVSISSYGNGLAGNYGVSQGNSVNNVRPVVFLDDSVYVINGLGTEAEPYILGM